jgi:hypothetical protein
MVDPPEVPHHHHHATGIRWLDIVMPIAVLCISVASLLAALQSEKSMHALVEQNERLVSAQSTPLLMLDTGNIDEKSGKPALSMTLSNVGTGPAEIRWFRVVDGAGQDYTGGPFYSRVQSKYGALSFFSTVISGTLMRSGDSRLVWSWPRPDGHPEAMTEWNDLDKTTRWHLQASACYCSIFEECRVTHFGDSRPERVASCEEAKAGR